MKLLIYTDPHICTASSIVIGKTAEEKYDRFSARLDTCIKTFEYINDLATFKKADKIICLGDLVDNSKLTAEELTAISMSNIKNHIMLAGNHDVSSNDNFFNSCNFYQNAITKATIEKIDDNCTICYLPYTKEPIDLDILLKDTDPNKTLILSHNDIAGIFYGKFLNTYGYNIDKIKKYSRLFINGHLHSGQWIEENRVLNLGTITGLNFNNCNGFTGKIIILNTEDFSMEWFDNPFAYKFYDKSIASRLQLGAFLESLNPNVQNVVQLRIPRFLIDICQEKLNGTTSIKFFRLLTSKTNNEDTEEITDVTCNEKIETTLNIFDSLRKYVKENNTKYNLDSVLNEINELEKV